MIIVNLLGVLLIALIIWWFWLFKPDEVRLEAGGTVVTVQDGVYTPANIQVTAGELTELAFLRKDQSPCSETVLFPELEISESLPVGKIKNISLGALKPGTYAFHCQMQMYRGEIHAR